MRLTRVDVHNDKDLAKKVKELYRLAFPKEERVAWPLLWYNTKRKDIALTAYLDEELFCLCDFGYKRGPSISLEEP